MNTTKLIMKLFVTGRSVRSEAAIENLHSILDEFLESQFDLTVIDVLENPQMAEEDLILATPTLVKLNPSPVIKIIGDLSNTKLILDHLDIQGFECNTTGRTA